MNKVGKFIIITAFWTKNTRVQYLKFINSKLLTSQYIPFFSLSTSQFISLLSTRLTNVFQQITISPINHHSNLQTMLPHQLNLFINFYYILRSKFFKLAKPNINKPTLLMSSVSQVQIPQIRVRHYTREEIAINGFPE